MKHWTEQPYFLDRERSFFSPTESAATLGLMRTFRVYKPELAMASFLEIEHYGSGWIPFLWILIPFLAVVAYGYFS